MGIAQQHLVADAVTGSPVILATASYNARATMDGFGAREVWHQEGAGAADLEIPLAMQSGRIVLTMDLHAFNPLISDGTTLTLQGSLVESSELVRWTSTDALVGQIQMPHQPAVQLRRAEVDFTTLLSLVSVTEHVDRAGTTLRLDVALSVATDQPLTFRLHGDVPVWGGVTIEMSALAMSARAGHPPTHTPPVSLWLGALDVCRSGPQTVSGSVRLPRPLTVDDLPTGTHGLTVQLSTVFDPEEFPAPVAVPQTVVIPFGSSSARFGIPVFDGLVGTLTVIATAPESQATAALNLPDRRRLALGCFLAKVYIHRRVFYPEPVIRQEVERILVRGRLAHGGSVLLAFNDGSHVWLPNGGSTVDFAGAPSPEILAALPGFDGALGGELGALVDGSRLVGPVTAESTAGHVATLSSSKRGTTPLVIFAGATEAPRRLPKGTFSAVTAINAVGVVAGVTTTAKGPATGWVTAVFQDAKTPLLTLDAGDGVAVVPTAVNGNGVVAGTTYDAKGRSRAFLWTQPTGLVVVDDLLEDAKGVSAARVLDLDDRGDLLVAGEADGEPGWFVLEPKS